MAALIFLTKMNLNSMMYKSLYKNIIIFLLLLSVNAQAEFIVTLRSPEYKGDDRENYTIELITLALEKTKNEYGSYKIEYTQPMNVSRSIFSLNTNRYTNYVVELSYQDSLVINNELIYVDIPVDLGVVGYRVCFVNHKIHKIIKNTSSLAELKKYEIAQGVGWADGAILRKNGFNVVEASSYIGIIQLVANNRAPLFCRGANEIKHEYEIYKNTPGLELEQSFAIFYPLPRFYFFNKRNLLAKERIEKGMIAAHKDGSLQALWSKHYLDSIKYAELKQRKIYKIDNPFIKTLNTNYQRYFYDPTK